ncbi:TIM protein, partial [Crypturellus soui]|nr:TIM protein [Crypturellus soui]
TPWAGSGVTHSAHAGLATPLQWLANYLTRTAGDREEDGISQPVPLVPLSEANEDAMEDRRFQALLRKVGLRPPASEQESFWRIPAALTPRQLRCAAAALVSSEPHGALRSPLAEGPGRAQGSPGASLDPLLPSVERPPPPGSDSE